MPDQPAPPSAHAPLPVLDPAEQRVLGCLLEKEVTVPASYPLTLNAVRSACNQSSSREPVVDYDEPEVHAALRSLKDEGLVGVTWQDSGRRTMKYVQRAAVAWSLTDEARALLTVLLLRGAQQPGALRTRTERLHTFETREDVTACLERLAAAEPPLVARLERLPREQDHRWVHLLGPVEEAQAERAPTASGAEGESVLAQGAEARDERVRRTYDTVASSYADALSEELAGLPFERWLLDRVVAEVGSAPVVEVGTGPGHVAAHLTAAGVTATGLDLSPAMVEQARLRHPGTTYEVGDLRRLMRPAAADGWGAVLGWYSLIHLAPSELPAALESLLRPLRPGGVLLLALHAGEGLLTGTEWFGHEVDQRVVLHRPAEVVALLERAGLTEVEWYLRGPRTSRGETTQRLYVLARSGVRPA
ncbi:hypothetical protein GCM10011519_01260 [Marmoricola endophyticus]|uniref:Methyltransferase domain-containing protein n=1 Tax=Marmoricola endophyticus TaxID=2040280 RepID=A0A917BCD5_9ACTN|nr:DUF480 domain-containing protein [Marmoricola endophyticus]GGF31643.1 hypothetical protein GCM10011519_01260 [Marmoricola endophyticus]